MGKVGNAKHAAHTNKSRARHAKPSPRRTFALPVTVAAACLALCIPAAFMLNGAIGTTSQSDFAQDARAAQEGAADVHEGAFVADSANEDAAVVDTTSATAGTEAVQDEGVGTQPAIEGQDASAKAGDASQVANDNAPDQSMESNNSEAVPTEPAESAGSAEAVTNVSDQATDGQANPAAVEPAQSAGGANGQENVPDASASNADKGASGSSHEESALGIMTEKLATAKASAYAETHQQFEGIVENGGAITQEGAISLAAQSMVYTWNVREMLQEGVLDTGCEIVSLAVVLRSMGVAADPVSIANEHLDLNGNFADGYIGNPYYGGGGFPAGIVRAANSYLGKVQSSLVAYDLTGSSFDTLVDIVSMGYPVLVWTTTDFEDPYFTGDVQDGYAWYGNEHCVVMYGVENGNVLLNDSLEGIVERDAARFAEIYEKCGSMAVYVR